MFEKLSKLFLSWCPAPAGPVIYKFLSILFLIYTLCLTAVSVSVAVKGVKVETDIQALIPSGSVSLVVNKSKEVLDASFNDVIVVVVANDKKEDLVQVEEIINASLVSNELIEKFQEEEFIQQYYSLADVYRPFRFNFLSEIQNQKIHELGARPTIEAAWQNILGLHQMPAILSFSDDPMAIFNNYFLSLPIFNANAILDDDKYINFPFGESGKRYGKLILIKINRKALDLKQQSELVGLFDGLSQDIGGHYPGVVIVRSGVVFHAEYAARKAKHEFSLISLVSIIFIVILMVFCFRSFKPLLLGVASVGFGFVAALLLCSQLFPNIHIITLVFGAGLIGVVIDYALHYFSYERYCKQGNDKSVLSRIFPSLLMGVCTTVAGYACLYQTTLPGLREIASFCIIGLISAWLFVVVVYPRFDKKTSVRSAAGLLRSANIFHNFWSVMGCRKSAAIIFLVVSLSALSLVFYVDVNNNVKSFYNPPAHFFKQDLKIASLFGQQSLNQYFVVEGESQEQVLQIEEQLRARMDGLVGDGALSGYKAVSQYLPSILTQSQNYSLLNRSVYRSKEVEADFFNRLGIQEDFKSDFYKTVSQAEKKYLLPGNFIQHAPKELQSLWLNDVEGLYASIVLLVGISDVKVLAKLATVLGGVTFIDRVESISLMLSQQYSQALYMLLFAYILISAIVLLRYRQIGGLSIVCVPLLSLLVALGVLSAMSVSIGIFHVLALFLSLGLGLDYGIFLYDSAASDESKLAVMLSALTSCLSFGLLAFSSTPMISAFGITLLLSVLTSLIVAPLLIGWGRHHMHGVKV